MFVGDYIITLWRCSANVNSEKKNPFGRAGISNSSKTKNSYGNWSTANMEGVERYLHDKKYDDNKDFIQGDWNLINDFLWNISIHPYEYLWNDEENNDTIFSIEESYWTQIIRWIMNDRGIK